MTHDPSHTPQPKEMSATDSVIIHEIIARRCQPTLWHLDNLLAHLAFQEQQLASRNTYINDRATEYIELRQQLARTAKHNTDLLLETGSLKAQLAASLPGDLARELVEAAKDMVQWVGCTLMPEFDAIWDRYENALAAAEAHLAQGQREETDHAKR